MTIKEFRDFADSLGRFASAKERKEQGPKQTSSHKHKPWPISFGPRGEDEPVLFACSNPDSRGNRCSKVWRAEELNMQYDPTDLVFIQAVGGTLKLVAGTADSTLIVNAGPTTAQGKALVSARTLLNAAKSLRGKGDITFAIDNGKSVTITVSTGGEMTLPNESTTIPRWLKPDVQASGGGPFPAKFWPEAAKVVAATTGDYWPLSHVHLRLTDGTLLVSSTDGVALGSTFIPAEGDRYLVGSLSSVFVTAIKNLAEAGTLSWGESSLTVISGPYTAVTQLYRVADPIPAIVVPDAETTVTVDRKVMADMVKAVASNDEHKRVALVARNAALTVHPFDSREASVKVPAEVEGDGTVGVDAGVLGRLLSAAPGKTVSLGWSGSRSPIQFVDKDSTWRTLLAPVA